MDQEWKDYVDKIQTQLTATNLIPTQQEKLWNNLLNDPMTTQSSSDESVDEQDYRLRRISDLNKSKSERKKIRQRRYESPYLFYDFSQNRYSSNDKNLDGMIEALTYSSTEALKCANMQREFTAKISRAHVYMVLSMNDRDTKPTAYVYRLNIIKTVDINWFIKRYNATTSNNGKNRPESKDNEEDEEIDSVSSLILSIIKNNIDEFHKEVLTSKYCTATNFIEIIAGILGYLRLKQEKKERDNILLLQERAIIILADVIWQFYQRYYKEFLEWIKPQNISNIIRQNQISSKQENIKQLCEQMESLKKTQPNTDDMRQYYGFLEPFLKASNEKELQDFNECAQDLLQQHTNIAAVTTVKYQNINLIYKTESGMRVGISSANASDNWTNSKLNGGVTINMSINLDSIKATPVIAEVKVIPNNNVIRLSTTHTMYGNVTEDKMEFNKDNIDKFLKIDDNTDVFRMLKYALIFVGIVKDPHSVASSPTKSGSRSSNISNNMSTKPQRDNKQSNYSSILKDIGTFTGGHGLSLSVTNLGPSRSGFASSSAVACNLLKVLYSCCNNPIANDDQLLGSMALLLENRLGLKSGRQDVDGLLPNGVKVLHYNQTTGFVSPKISFLSKDRFNVNELGKKMILVNSGIARASGLGLHRGLNMRFLAYLSRDPVRFKSILQSYKIHDEIIKALQCNNYCYLGKLFLDYMSCRERIDPGATQSKYDKDHNNEKILRKLFDPLVHKNLIYGGMFTGAMGGGVAMLSLTDYAMEEIQISGNKTITNIEYALNELKQWKTQNGSQPFQRLSRIEYSVNVDGILLSKVELEQSVKDKTCNDDEKENTKLVKKQYLLKSIDDNKIVCYDNDFEKIKFLIKDSGLNMDEINKIKNIAKQGETEKKDVHIVVFETHTNDTDNNITRKISHAIKD